MFAAPFARRHALPFCVALAACGNEAGRADSAPVAGNAGTSGSGAAAGVSGAGQGGGLGGGSSQGGSVAGGAGGTSGTGGGGEPVSVTLYEAERGFFTGASVP